MNAVIDDSAHHGSTVDEDLLDDAERLAEADVLGLLRSAASAGAQVRSVAAAAGGGARPVHR